MESERKIEDIIEIMDRAIPELMLRNCIPGFSLAAMKDGNIFCRTWGVKNSKTLEPVSPETIFEGASLSKPVVAYTALKMCEDRLLALDTPLNNYLQKPYSADCPLL